MRGVVQRVSKAKVTVDGKVVGQINQGLMVLLGMHENDEEQQIDKLVKKVANLRIFQDENGKMNLSVKDIDGEVLVVSQFTLYGDCKKGNRPSFVQSMEPKKADHFYEIFVEKMRGEVRRVETGSFGANMDVEFINQGPVTLIVEV